MTMLRDELSKDNLTLPAVLKQIIDKFGLNILLNKQKCIGIFKDLAPSLKEEEKILDVALKLDVGTYFVNVQEDEREAAIKKAIYAMDGILADGAVELIVSALVSALNWDEALLTIISKSKKDKNQESLQQEKASFNIVNEETRDKEVVSDDANLHEEKIKAATEATLQKADDIKVRIDNWPQTEQVTDTLQKADYLKEKAYVAAGVAANIASIVYKKATEKVAETNAKPNVNTNYETETIQTYGNEIGEPDVGEFSNNNNNTSINNTTLGNINTQAKQNVANSVSVSNNVLISNNYASASIIKSSPIANSPGNIVVNSSQSAKGSDKFKKGLIAASVLILGGFCFYFMSNNGQKEVSQPEYKATEVVQQKQPVIQQPVANQPIVKSKSNIDLAKEQLARMGYPNSPLTATTYGRSNDGFLVFEHRFIFIVDVKNNRVSCLLNTAETIEKYKLYRKKNINNPLILKFGVIKDTRDKDAKNGIWDKEHPDFHTIPVYVLYDFNPDGTMVDKGLYSGEGENPSHFHNYLYEQKNVDMVNIFLKQLPYFDQGVFNDFPMAEDSSINKTMASPSSVKSTNNSVEARNTFIRFHQAITDKRLGDAYFILSPSYQKVMRSYDNFARGYITTLRSDIVELNTLHEDSTSASYSYKLKAVDREGSGTKTQYFAGKVKLIKINGSWRIDSTEAKRL